VAGDSAARLGGPLTGLAPGSRVARYLIEELVGVGGMAAVFRARDVGLGRLVALKLLTGDEAGVARHLRSIGSLTVPGQFLGTPDYAAPPTAPTTTTSARPTTPTRGRSASRCTSPSDASGWTGARSASAAAAAHRTSSPRST
jgi:hypothetical protein